MPSPPLIILDGMPIPSYPPGFEAVRNPWFDAPGLYETLYVREGRPQNVEKHLARLKKGWMRWSPESFDEAWPGLLQAELAEALRLNEVNQWGRGRYKIFRTPDGRLHRAAEAEPMESDPRLHSAPARLGIYREEQIPLQLTSGYKIMSRGIWHRATQWAQQQGWDDAVMLHEGRVAETSFCNFFMRKDDLLITPPLRDGGLGGLMRSLVMEAAERLSLPLREESFSPLNIAGAQEVFITNSLRGLWPVSQIEDYPLPQLEETWAFSLNKLINS